MSNSGNTLLAVIAGTAIGTTLGILFAPDKGSNTRKKIADEAAARKESLVEGASNLSSTISDRVGTHKETLDTKIESIMSDASYKAEDVINSLEKKLSQLKDKNKKLQKS